MPGAMPAEIAERLSDVPAPVITPAIMDQAREDLIERLIEGKNVNRTNARDIFAGAIEEGEVDYRTCLDLLEGLLSLDTKCGDSRSLAVYELVKKARGMVEAYVDGKEDWIRERAAEIAADEADDCLSDRD
jgi:hypothetical protein